MILIKSLIIIILYMTMFFLFGSFVTYGKKKGWCPQDGNSMGMTILLGFFLYYGVFQIVTLPMMFTGQPLHRLTILWTVLACLISVLSVLLHRGEWSRAIQKQRQNRPGDHRSDVFWKVAIVLVILVNIAIVSVIYSNYWDGTYYVGNVSYAVYYDSINTVNPLGGTSLQFFLEEFDLKHCLATYHVHDAVVCQLFRIHPMVETKTIMVIVITMILNLVYLRLARFFFPDNTESRAFFMGFCLLINLCTYSAYTSSSFILLRTYEGKAIAGAIVAVMLFYWFIRIFQEEKIFFWWGMFLTSWGAAAISSSALFLVVSGLGIFAVVQWIRTRSFRTVWYTVVCMIPAGLELLIILLYSAGILTVAVPS
jgi:hypothetical protein